MKSYQWRQFFIITYIEVCSFFVFFFFLVVVILKFLNMGDKLENMILVEKCHHTNGELIISYFNINRTNIEVVKSYAYKSALLKDILKRQSISWE